MVYFLDTSAIAKRYFREKGTPWITALVHQTAGNEILLASITSVEMVSAIARRERGGSIQAGAASLLMAQFRQALVDEYLINEITPEVLDRAMFVAEKYALRGYDAVQLATALTANDERLAHHLPALVLVSADDELNAAAQAEGLSVEDPNSHP